MRRVTHMNAAYHTCKCVVSHIWMCCVTHLNVLCHTYGGVMSHIWISHVTHLNASRHTYERGISRIWMCCVTHLNVLCHTYGGVMSHMWISHVTHVHMFRRKMGAWSAHSAGKKILKSHLTIQYSTHQSCFADLWEFWYVSLVGLFCVMIGLFGYRWVYCVCR